MLQQTIHNVTITQNQAKNPYSAGGIDNFIPLGANNIPGVFNFTPGITDIVPAAGVKTTNILSSALASNGGATQTHALVAGSPAINAHVAHRGPSRPIYLEEKQYRTLFQFPIA